MKVEENCNYYWIKKNVLTNEFYCFTNIYVKNISYNNISFLASHVFLEGVGGVTIRE